MSLSIGLEALNKSHVVEGSFESNYADFMESYTKVQDAAQQGLDLFTALENLSAINKTVKQFGFTKSMESLIGHQLGSTRASVEEETAKVSRTVWEKIIDWFKKMWRYVKDFFAKLANTRRGIMLNLKDIKAGKYSVKDANKSFEGWSEGQLKMAAVNIKAASASSEKLKTISELTSQKLTDGQITSYATACLAALEGMDAAEKTLLAEINKGLKVAQTGLGKPDADIDAARELKNSSAGIVSDVSKCVALAFRCAKNFVKYVKKG